MDKLEGYYKQLHFKCDDLELFYNMPVVSPDGTDIQECPNVDNLICSRAHELVPDNKCKTVRNCEILEMKDELFKEQGIRAKALRDLDAKMRHK